MELHEQRQLLEQRLRGKFRNHAVLYSKYTPQIPKAVDREYQRLVNAYIGVLKDALDQELPALKAVYRREWRAAAEEQRFDSATDLMLSLAEIFTRIQNRLISNAEGFGLRRRLENLAHLLRKLTVKEWKKAIRATLAIDIREDYYLGDFYAEELLKWVKENVDLIKTIPHDALGKMNDIVYDGYIQGKTATQIMRDIQKVYSVSRKRARFIARDQVAKLNGQIQRAQQMDAGIEEYIWSTSGDERVRDSHRKLNGKKFSWAEAPENEDGRCCHPGQDYNCRCIGRPVFKLDTLNLPLDEGPDMTVTIK